MSGDRTASSASDRNYKIGKPYKIRGVWYYPAEDWDYVETGIASWYGPNFHGKKTANGEIFDQWQVSAAHRTLPLPTYVRVTNLQNGKSIEVRINDRGPFAHGRIIDMSRRAAQLLGFEGQGTARVRVEINREKSWALARGFGAGGNLSAAEQPIKGSVPAKAEVSAERLSVPPGSVASAQQQPTPRQSAPPRPEPQPVSTQQATEETVQTVSVVPSNIYIQIGAFSRYDNANRVRASLSNVADVGISSTIRNGVELFRTRIGPISSVETADSMLQKVYDAGFTAANIIVE